MDTTLPRMMDSPTSLEIDTRRGGSQKPHRTRAGQSRVVIENVRPQIDAGRFPVKRIAGETIAVEADVFCDGHDALAVKLRYRAEEWNEWQEIDILPTYNDRWEAKFDVEQPGTYRFTIVGWVDRFLTWHRDFQKRAAADQVAEVDLLIGAQLIDAASRRASGEDRSALEDWARRLRHDAKVAGTSQVSSMDNSERVENLADADGSGSQQASIAQICSDTQLPSLMRQYSNREFATKYDRELLVTVDRPRAGFSAWYEMFPRSAANDPGRHGTLKDVETRLPYVAEMGFDVLYLPPIHPTGMAFRKGKNNTTHAEPDDVGSPWGIGSHEGGHKAIHPQLGTLDDFHRLVAKAREYDIEVALDVAFQCSPDHPYVQEHPSWFRQRPDGTIQYAENPPKKYQDIYPLEFECDDWIALWNELKSIFDYWIEQGVRIFRVDNPHTKPFAFWEWCIGEIKREHPDVLFLAEAFTRPKLMYRLAKLGFTQSYTYFAWRNTKNELTEYMTQLTRTDVHEFFRPNFWPNTPDILTEYLQVGGRPAFLARLVLAATLSPNYGIYGPPFEHCWAAPREPGSEEYLDSEKYQIQHHDLQRPDSLRHVIGRVNRIRREHPALQTMDGLQFHDVDNDGIICFSKSTEDRSQIILVVVSLDPHHKQSGWVDLPLKQFELDGDQPFQAHDLLSDARYLWHGRRNYVELDPKTVSAHIFQLRRRVRSERDFEAYV